MTAFGSPLGASGNDLKAIAARLEATGQVGLKRAMYRNLRAAVAPVEDMVRKSARETLPRSGGLNEYIADAVYKTTVRATPNTVNVTFRMRKPGSGPRAHDLPKIDAGQVRHPVYADTNKPRKDWSWAHETQEVQPGFFSRPMHGMTPITYRAMLEVMRETSAEAGFR